MVTATVTVGDRGLVRLPTAVRDSAGVEKGQELVAIAEGPGVIRLATREALRNEVWAAAPTGTGELDTVAEVRTYRAADRRLTDAKLTAPIRHDQPSDDSEADARAERVGVDLLAQFGL
jgi:bifunctional DNA-binding transcriptional regulator/antitoxin component of YhaV-PrlF toxin-antitoxin module